jgi:hypothetical protein
MKSAAAVVAIEALNARKKPIIEKSPKIPRIYRPRKARERLPWANERNVATAT